MSRCMISYHLCGSHTCNQIRLLRHSRLDPDLNREQRPSRERWQSAADKYARVRQPPGRARRRSACRGKSGRKRRSSLIQSSYAEPAEQSRQRATRTRRCLQLRGAPHLPVIKIGLVVVVRLLAASAPHQPNDGVRVCFLDEFLLKTDGRRIC